jgi:Na+/H+ antiporter NhaD/arsenite permease-like protein
MILFVIAIFVLGYLAIALEHLLNINKAAIALITGVLCWLVYFIYSGANAGIEESLLHHLSEISSILFFLLGAMTIVELIDAHSGFEVITRKISTTNCGNLIVILSFLTFFLSSLLDNLTSTIVMLSITGKLIENKEIRWRFAGMIVIAANAGGAWSPLGDVTTSMLWIGGQVSALNIIRGLFFPSLACIVLPLSILWFQLRKEKAQRPAQYWDVGVSAFERNIVFILGILSFILVPIIKITTHMPPFMGMLLTLGFLWVFLDLLHRKKDKSAKKSLTVVTALQKIDTPSVLFFLGILLAVGAIDSIGILKYTSNWLSTVVPNTTHIGILFGLVSAIIDNIPIVAAAQGMYPISKFPIDHYFWELLALTTGTGGSAIIIGSAAGVAAMGIERINFIWYIKNISWLAILGFFGAIVIFLALK